MQDLLHGVMGLIGMGHLQMREGHREPEKEEGGERVKVLRRDAWEGGGAKAK